MMDEDQAPKRIGREVLVALAIGTAMGLGAALGPDIADRCRVWIARGADAVERRTLATIEDIQHRSAIEREARRGTGPVVWEAMEAAREAAEATERAGQ